MAMVDFTNAKITPTGENPAKYAYMNMRSSVLLDASNNFIVTNSSVTQTKNDPKLMVFSYAGTFTTSGTEFYIWNASASSRWKVSNISFSSGDTYSFQIPTTLTCL